jgi:hypothetical protein
MKLKQKKTKVYKALGVLATSTALLAIPLGGTAYAASCYGSGCNYKGPVSQGCDVGALTRAQRNIDTKRAVELRWSSTCEAGWVRVTNVSPVRSWYAREGSIEQYEEIGHDGRQPGQLLRTIKVRAPQGGDDTGSNWSNMLGGTNYAYRACWVDAAAGEQFCSSYFIP